MIASYSHCFCALFLITTRNTVLYKDNWNIGVSCTYRFYFTSDVSIYFQVKIFFTWSFIFYLILNLLFYSRQLWPHLSCLFGSVCWLMSSHWYLVFLAQVTFQCLILCRVQINQGYQWYHCALSWGWERCRGLTHCRLGIVMGGLLTPLVGVCVCACYHHPCSLLSADNLRFLCGG